MVLALLFKEEHHRMNIYKPIISQIPFQINKVRDEVEGCHLLTMCQKYGYCTTISGKDGLQ